MSFKSGEKQDAFQQLMLTIMGAIAQFERSLLLERQREGIELAKARGVHKGKKSKFTEEQLATIKKDSSSQALTKLL